jgi:hypothetical protein
MTPDHTLVKASGGELVILKIQKMKKLKKMVLDLFKD